MKITYDPHNLIDKGFCQWLTRHEQDEPLEFELRNYAEISDADRITCLNTLPEYRGWAKLLSTPGLTKFARKVCVHLIAGRKTLPDQLFGKRNAEIVEALKQLPPRPAAAI